MARVWSSSPLRSAVLVALLSFGAGVAPAIAQTEGSIALVDEFYSCAANDWEAGIRNILVLQHFNPGSTASRFKVESGVGFTMTYLSEVHHFPMTLGNTQDGIKVCYGECLVATQLLVTISYLSDGTSGPCGLLQVVPHPAAETVEATRCDGVPVRQYVEDMWVASPGEGCGCPSTHVFPGTPRLIDCTAAPVDRTTWGAIKALYR